jgi:uncharacterized membrane protein required for colicin V production
VRNFLEQFNWVDLIVLVFLIRGIYQGAKNGLVLEFFSLGGWSAATFLSFKFYKKIARILHQRTEIPLAIDELLTFAAIIIATIVVTRIIGDILKHVIKIKIIERLNRTGGAFLGFIKSALVLSVLFYTLSITSIPYLEKSIKEKSLSGKAISRISEIVYVNIKGVMD